MADDMQRVGEGVHRFADGLVNWYVIEEDGQLTIVDAGWPRSWPRLERAISRLGRSVGDVAAVVLTHGHPDHLGGAPVMAYREEVPRVKGEARDSAPFALSCRTSGGSSRWGSSSGLRRRVS